MANPGPILYIAGQLPKLSETFVYREVLALRASGLDVHVASVHTPSESFDAPELRSLQDQAVVVYSRGPMKIAGDVLAELVSHPIRTGSTIARGKLDAFFAKDVCAKNRLKVVLQCVASISLARRIRPINVTHIHAHFAHVPTTIAMYTARQLGIGFSFTGHANDLFAHRTLLSCKLDRTKFVSCISDWHREWYDSITSGEESARPTIRCGVDTELFAPAQQTENTIVCIARLVEKKGIDTLIEACSMLRDRDIEFVCKIGGDGPMVTRLQSMVTERKLNDHIEFLGAMANENVRKLVQSAAVFCLPCRDDSSGDRDGIPVALMESMACGVSTVSGDLPAIRELITDRVTGRLVPGGDAESLADVLEELLGDPDYRVQLSERGRKRVIEEFSRDVNTDRLIKAFTQIKA